LAPYEELYSKYPLFVFLGVLSLAHHFVALLHTPNLFLSWKTQLEQNIIKPGAEGKLLVLDVKLRSPSDGSSVTNDGTSLYSW